MVSTVKEIKERLRKRMTTHGLSRSGTYHYYRTLRGNNPGMFCEEWKTFEGFLRDMGLRPDGKYISRKNDKQVFCKLNCKWADRKSNAVMLTYKGETMNQAQWAIRLNCSATAIYLGVKKYGTLTAWLSGRK